MRRFGLRSGGVALWRGWSRRLWPSLLVAVMLLSSLAPGSANAESGPADDVAVTPQIFNGSDVPAPNPYPWMVALFRGSEPGEGSAPFCGGSLVAPRWVLTAAHCVISGGLTSAPSEITAVAAVLDLGAVAPADTRSVKAVTPHPQYDPGTLGNDVALLELQSPFDQIEPLPLIQPRRPLPIGTAVRAVGWGEDGLSNFPSRLQWAALQVAAGDVASTCGNWSAQQYRSDIMVCAGGNGTQNTAGVCSGDSGGPLLVEGTRGGWELAGVSSFVASQGSTKCTLQGVPGVFARVSAFTPWICERTRRFVDVPFGAYYDAPAHELWRLGVTTGTSASCEYSPSQPVSRSQMALFLWRLAGMPTAPTSCGFSDVPATAGYAQAACWLLQQRITTNNPYQPSGVVTRGQMAAFLWRIVGQPSASNHVFRDEANIPAWARRATDWLFAQGITTNDPYNPNGVVTRGQMAAFLARITPALTSAGTLPGAPAALAGVPTNISGGGQQVQLTWEAPADNGRAIRDYIVEYSSNSGATWTTFDDGVGVATAVTVTGLVNGTGYLFRVAAINEAGTGAFSTSSGTVTPYSFPGSPTRPVGLPGDVDTGGAMVELSWGAPADNGRAITDYLVEYSSDLGATWTTFDDGVSPATTAAVTGLVNGTGYLFRVAATNDVGTGALSSTSDRVTPYTLPDTPASPVGTAGNDEVQIAWAAPAGNGRAITDYIVEYSSDSGATWTTFVDGVSVATTVTVTGLVNGTSYLFRVAAVNLAGTGGFSGSSEAVVPRRVPDAPSQLVASPVNLVNDGGQVELTWSAPGDNGRVITDYVIQYSSGAGGSWTDFDDGASDATTTTVTGLVNGTSYLFRVAAANAVGIGIFSGASGPVVPYARPGVLSVTTAAPANVANGGQQVHLSWDAPAANGRAITDYVVEYSSDSGASWTTFGDGVSSATTTTVTGLANGAGYSFRVAATNEAGTGGFSDETGDVVPYTIPDAPTGIAVAPANIANGGQRVQLAWSAPADNGRAVTDYVIEYSSDAGATWTTLVDSVSTSTLASITGLTNGTSYIFRVAAVNFAGAGMFSDPSAVVVPYTLPGAPTVPSAAAANIANGGMRVQLSWSAPSDNGRAITDYVIEYSSDSGATWIRFVDAVSAATTASVTGLTNGTSYVFRVAAVNLAGTGEFSAASAVATPYTLPGTPAQPTAEPGDGVVVLSWSAPAGNGRAITDYLVEFSTDAGNTWTRFADGTSTSTTASVTGLANGTSYVFRVAAVNLAGTGTFSDPSAAAVPFTLPGGPTGLSAAAANIANGGERVQLSWVAPADNGGPVSDYVIEYSSDSGATWIRFVDAVSAATTASVTGLTNGISYVFRVAAVNLAGTGVFSAVSAVATPYTLPGTPAQPTAEPGDGVVVLSWSAPAGNGRAITDYLVEFSTDAGNTWTRFADGTSTSTTASVTGLANGTSYVFRVAAVNLAGTGTFSDSSEPIVPRWVPEAPAQPTASPANTANGGQQVTLTWTAPADNGQPITDYVIEYSSNTGATWTSFTDGISTSTAATVTGLVNGTSYFFRVAAVNLAGVGAISANSAAVVPYTRPSAPVILSAVPVNINDGGERAFVSWSTPAGNGRSVTDYILQYSSNSGASWTTFNTGVSTSTSATVIGLVNEVTYIFRVAAINEAGTGAYSASSGTVTPYRRSTLSGGERLDPGQSLWSRNGVYQLRMQSEDGNLVLYSPRGAIWESDTEGNYDRPIAIMGTNGDFTVVAPGNRVLWGTGTYDNPGAWLNLQDDGNLVIYTASNFPIWATMTIGR